MEEKTNLGWNTVVNAESKNNNQIYAPSYALTIEGKFIWKKNRNKKIEIKKNSLKKKREKELNLMSLSLNNIGNSISNENIGNYLDKNKELSGTEIPQLKHIYFKGIGKSKKLMAEI